VRCKTRLSRHRFGPVRALCRHFEVVHSLLGASSSFISTFLNDHWTHTLSSGTEITPSRHGAHRVPTENGGHVEAVFDWLDHQEAPPDEANNPALRWVKDVLSWSEATRVSREKNEDATRRARTKKRQRNPDEVPLPIPKRLAVHRGRFDSSTLWATWSTWSGKSTKAIRRKRMLASKVIQWRELVTKRPAIVGDLRFNRDTAKIDRPMVSHDQIRKVWLTIYEFLSVLLNPGDSSGEKPRFFVSQMMALLEYCDSLRTPEYVIADSTMLVRSINSNLNVVANLLDTCIQHETSLLQLWYTEGTDTAVFKRAIAVSTPFRLDMLDDLKRQVNDVIAWESKVEKELVKGKKAGRSEIQIAKELLEEGSKLGYASRETVALRVKYAKATNLQNRIADWQRSTKTHSMKHVSGLVREVRRLNWSFSEATTLIGVHEEALAWMDRATVAMRSRLSIAEVKGLIDSGNRSAVDLNDIVQKLRSRVHAATKWSLEFEQLVPTRMPVSAQMKDIRFALGDHRRHSLLELADVGSKLPVRLESVVILQIEIDGLAWQKKATRLNDRSQKKPKLEEVSEHLSRADDLRGRLKEFSDVIVSEWVLESESSLKAGYEAATDWLAEYNVVAKRPLSYEQLNALLSKLSTFHVNVGASLVKLERVVEQLTGWFVKYRPVVQVCLDQIPAREKLEERVLRLAVEEAKSIAGVRVEEIIAVKKVLATVDDWLELTAVGIGGEKKSKQTSISIDLLNQLVEQSSSLVIDTSVQAAALKRQIDATREWQAQAASTLREVERAIAQTRMSITGEFGIPEEFSRATVAIHSSSLEGSLDETKGGNTQGFVTKLKSLVKTFVDTCSTQHVSTDESRIAAKLEAVLRWFSKFLHFLEHTEEIFNKSSFALLDRLYKDGQGLVNHATTSPVLQSVVDDVRAAWKQLISDQLHRLSVLIADKNAFVSWIDAFVLRTRDKKPTLDKLLLLKAESESFPCHLDEVKKLQLIVSKAESFIALTEPVLTRQKKLSMKDLATLCTEGDNLDCICHELKSIKAALRAAKAWANRVKKSKVDEGAAQTKVVQRLILEYDELLVTLPDEMEKLNRAMTKYCICRRPYEGFMIGCDECGEWFHGTCIGVSEARADRVDKFVCLRCNVVSTFRSGCADVAGVVKKWTNLRDLKRARQLEFQKHQRKIRKEQKSLESLQKQIATVRKKEKALSLPSATPLAPPLLPLSQPAPNAFSATQSSESTLQSNSEQISTLGSAASTISSTPTQALKQQPPLYQVNALPAGNGPDHPRPQLSNEHSGSQLLIDSAKNQAGSDTELQIHAHAPSVSNERASLEKSMEIIKARVAALEVEWKETSKVHKQENEKASSFAEWCRLIRSSILTPATSDEAQRSIPQQDCKLSEPMSTTISEGERLGLQEFEDFRTVSNALRTISWSLAASHVLCRRPDSETVHDIVEAALQFKLSNERAFRTLRAMSKRADLWTRRVKGSMAPKPGDTRALDLDVLKELSAMAEDLPFHLKFESRLHHVIKDKGRRYCICGGPDDGRFMLGCVKCDRKYHGHCVRLKTEDQSSKEWICGLCSGQPLPIADINDFHSAFKPGNSIMSDALEEEAPKAPKLSSMWPPFGLAGSEQALRAFGMTHANSVVRSLQPTTSQQKLLSIPISQSAGRMMHMFPVSTSVVPFADSRSLTLGRDHAINNGETKSPVKDSSAT